MKKITKKAEEGMPWHIIAAILALVFLLIGFVLIGKSYASGTSILDGLRGMF